MTQTEHIRAHLQAGQDITPLEALDRYGCFPARLAHRRASRRRARCPDPDRSPERKGIRPVPAGRPTSVAGMNLRKEARGRGCMVRLPGVCNHNSETVVLAHVRLAGVSGMGMKSDDLIGAWSCSSCHDAIDRRSHADLERDYVRLAHLEGMVRTIAQLRKEGAL
jgi:hypothetical protein